MKKAISLLLALALCLSLCACGGGNDSLETTVVPVETTKSAEDQMQKLIDYNNAVELLDSLSNTDKQVVGKDWELMQKAYNILLNLGDYKNASELLSCFTEYSCCTVGREKTLCDSNGDVVAWIPSIFGFLFWCSNEYDDNKRIVRTDYTSPLGSCYTTYEYGADDYSATRYWSGVEIWYDGVGFTSSEMTYHCKFNEKWQLIEETSKWNRFTYTYDDTGRLLARNDTVFDEKGFELYTNSYAATYTTVHLYSPLQQ